MDLDVQGEAEAALTHQVVSEEELARLTVRRGRASRCQLGGALTLLCAVLQVPDGLSDLERARLYVNGEQVQFRAAMDALPGLVRVAGRSAFRIILAVADKLPDLDEESQAAMAAAFSSLGHERLLPPQELAELLPAVLAGVCAQGQPGLQPLWLACLRDMAPSLDPHTLRGRLLPIILARGSGGAPGLAARCLSCQLLGVLAPHLPREELERTGVRSAAAMCQDTEWQVRRAVCEQLPALAAAAAGVPRLGLPHQGAPAAGAVPAGHPRAWHGAEGLVLAVVEETVQLTEDEEVGAALDWTAFPARGSVFHLTVLAHSTVATISS